MKNLTLVLLGSLLMAVNLPADVSQADKKWCEVVEVKIAAGPTEISTPSEQRAKLAQAMAEKKGKKCEIIKTDSGFRVVVK